MIKTNIMADKKYKSLNLPGGLIEELKVWKAAYTASYGASVSYEKMIRGMLDGLEDTEPSVANEFKRIVSAHPELLDKFSVED